MSVWGPSPSHILQIHSLHQVATGTPSHVPLRRRGIIITIFRGSGTNCMVPSDWDLAPKCVCGPNFISYVIGEFPILSAGRNAAQWRLPQKKRVSPAEEIGIWHYALFLFSQVPKKVHQPRSQSPIHFDIRSIYQIHFFFWVLNLHWWNFFVFLNPHC